MAPLGDGNMEASAPTGCCLDGCDDRLIEVIILLDLCDVRLFAVPRYHIFIFPPYLQDLQLPSRHFNSTIHPRPAAAVHDDVRERP